MAKSPSNSEIPTGAVSAANPEAGGIMQLSPEDEAIVSQYAQQRGITKADAVRQLLDYIGRRAEQEQAKPTVMDRTLGVIDQAQKLGVASTDPSDVVNTMGRGMLIKSFAKSLDGDNASKKISIEDLKEMWYLSFMGKMAGINESSGGGTPDVIKRLEAQNKKLMQEMKERDAKHEQQIKDMEEKRQAEKEKAEEKSENDKRFERLENLILELKKGGTSGNQSEVDKLIQEMREKDAKHKEELDKMKSDIHDMVFEKKIQDLEKSQEVKDELYRQDIKTLNDKVELIRSIPPTATTPKDAVSELEEIGGKLQRIKTAMEPIFPHVSAPAASNSTLPPVPATPLKNPDGSTDYIAAAERLGTIVVKGLEAINKEKPPKTNIAGVAQPAQADQPAYTEKRMSPEEYADYLLSLPTRTAEQEQWLINYRAYLEREYAKLLPAARQQPVQQHPATKPVQQVTGCSICGNPVYQDGYCMKCWADINVPKQQEPAETTWEQAEATRARLIQKQEWTGEEARWMNEYEKVRQAAAGAGAATQQSVQAEPPRVQEYKPPASEVHAGQVQVAGAEVQPEAQPEVQPVEEPVPQPEAELLQGTQAEVQAVIEPLAGQSVESSEEQPQEGNAEGTVALLRKEEEERTARLKGIL